MRAPSAPVRRRRLPGALLLAGIALLALPVAAGRVAGAEGPAKPGAPPPPPEAPAPADGGLWALARKAAAAKDGMEALRLYFAALREDVGYDVKYAMRDDVLALPTVPARAMDEQERATVRARIAEERDRDVVQKAVAFEGKRWLHAAHLLRARLKALDGIATARVEALGKELERLEKAICESPTDEEKAEAKEIEGGPNDVAGAFERAAKAVAAGKGRSALKAYVALGYSGVATQEQKDKARELHAQTWKALVAAVPEEQKVAADKVWDDPHWNYLGTSVSPPVRLHRASGASSTRSRRRTASAWTSPA